MPEQWAAGAVGNAELHMLIYWCETDWSSLWGAILLIYDEIEIYVSFKLEIKLLEFVLRKIPTRIHKVNVRTFLLG